MTLLLERLKAWRRQRAKVLLCEGGARLLTGALLGLSAALWLDRALLLPQSVRAALWLAGAAALSGAIWRLFWRPWSANRWPEVLAGVTREFPELRAHLGPAWELAQRPPAHTSRQLAQAHIEDTQRRLAALPQRPAFRWRASSGLRRAAVLALLGVCTWPWLGEAAWKRVLAPWRDVPLESFIAVAPGDAAGSLGQPATITARLTGAAGGPRRAGEARLWLRTSGAWAAVPWQSQSGPAASFTVVSLAEPLQYRLSWRGLTGRVFHLSPVLAPQLESLQARVGERGACVALTGAQPLSARRGSRVTLSGRPNQELARAFLRASFLPAPLALRCSRDCEVSFPAREDGSFSFELETVDGRRDPEPISYALKAMVDEPPTAELLSPRQPVQADAAGSLPVAFAARDDSALTRVSLLVEAPGRASREIVLRSFGDGGPKDFVGDFAWPLSGLPVGAKVEFRIKAIDDAAPPQSGVSQAGVVEIVDFSAGHAAAEQSWRKAESALGRLAAREESLRDLYAAGRLEAARPELPALSEDWKRALAASAELSQAMDHDAYANPGLREEFSRAAEGLQGAADRELPAALDSDHRSDAPTAAARHERLAAAARRAERTLREGRAVQGLQDFYLEAGRMSQDAASLASELKSLVGKGQGAPSAEAAKRLQQALKSLRERMADLQKTISALPQAQPGGAEAKARRGYQMPLLEAQTSADALQAALRAGDYESAAAIAQEMARQLESIEAAVTAAAAAGAQGAAQARGSQRVQRLQTLWSEVVEAQTRLVEGSQALEERRRQRFLDGQKGLLARLASEQAVLVSSASAWGPDFPAEILGLMNTVREEFASGRVSRAPELIRQAVAWLRASAARPSSRAGLGWFASAQEDIGKRLAEAPAAPPPSGPDGETAAAAQGQAAVRQKTAALQQELESLSEDLSEPPSEALEKVESAQTEQKTAEGELGRGDAGSALPHQEKALELLQQGGQQLQRLAEARQQIELGIGAGFSQPARAVRPAGGGGGLGARVEFVPLPKAQDYLPPKALREELERSLRERRPAAYDGAVKEYFKRLSQ